MGGFIRNDDILRYLARETKNVDLSDSNGNSALHLAVSLNQAKMVYNLLLVGANADKLNNNDVSPRQLAKSADNKSLLGLFVV